MVWEQTLYDFYFKFVMVCFMGQNVVCLVHELERNVYWVAVGPSILQTPITWAGGASEPRLPSWSPCLLELPTYRGGVSKSTLGAVASSILFLLAVLSHSSSQILMFVLLLDRVHVKDYVFLGELIRDKLSLIWGSLCLQLIALLWLPFHSC